MFEMDIAAKFATQWTDFFIFSKRYAKSYLAAKFQLNTTRLHKDIQFFVKNNFFG